jgi:DNA adenine methylase
MQSWNAGMKQTIMKPFLKWAGSKTKVVKHLRPLFPVGEYRLIEPFVGSGVVFLNTDYQTSLLSDANEDIINIFQSLKDNGENFIRRCKRLFTEENNSQERFYELREDFNDCEETEERAALFLYLNRHCFNGLCR